MKLYDYYRSSASYRVRIALHLKEIEYEAIAVSLIKNGGEQHLPSYSKLNPQNLVPTIQDHEHILSQSLAIIELLEEINPTPALLPDNPWDKAQVRSLALIIACEMHPLNNLRVMQQLKSQFNASDDQVTSWYHLWLKKGFDGFESRLKGLPRQRSVCFGKDITLADLCLIPQVYNAKRFQFPLDDYPLIMEINDYCLMIPAFIDAAPKEKNAVNPANL